ncbi:MAG: hypothetical protein M9944_08050 [Rhizobiaceae bacterium]|nr:hypothetical protein [Rhizobiaceae bacterium]
MPPHTPSGKVDTDMTIKLASLKVDLQREKTGDWIAYPELPGVEFKVSSLHLSEFVNARNALNKRLAKSYKGVDVPESVRLPELGKLLAKYILHDWRGFDEDYTPEKAYEYLSDWAGRDVTSAVLYCASVIGQSDAEFVEDAGKKSGQGSAGASKASSAPTG